MQRLRPARGGAAALRALQAGAVLQVTDGELAAWRLDAQ